MSAQLHLLRGFELRYDGAPVDLPLGSQRVLAFLALQDRPVHRLYAAGTLWLRAASQERANANLRSALWRLRQAGHDLVVSTPSHLCLHEQVEVDLHRAIERSRTALSSTSMDGFVPGDDLAGDLLPDWYDDWVEADRERLRQLRLHALEAIGEQLLAQARYGQAVDACLIAIRLDPLRESPRRLLLRTFAAEGNWNEAFQHYRAYSRRLLEEAGLEPSPQMQDLLRDLLT